jgi:sodium-dependent dicarboxylate transporter 2/3/5
MSNPPSKINYKRLFFMLLGIGLFFGIYLSPPWGDAVDPMGKHFPLTHQGKAAMGLFCFAAVWWVFEVVPIGVTSIGIGVLQVLFLIRPPAQLAGQPELLTLPIALGEFEFNQVIPRLGVGRGEGDRVISGVHLAFKEFFHPSVWFIFGSIVIGKVFTKTGLTQRLAYKMLTLVGEKTSRIYLGSFLLTAVLTHIMAHTAVAATIYPLLVAIYHLYTDEEKPTRFGKGLFMGMAFVAGAGSIVTLLGAARGAVAIGFYKELTGDDVTFFGLTKYMFLVGWTMVFVLWGFMMVWFKPEKKEIPGLRERARDLSKRQGAIKRQEILALVITLAAVAFMSLRSFVPALSGVNKGGIILTATILFFVFNILDIKDLESIPWNIILLFGGAMSLGYCLVATGAADWMAVSVVSMLESAPAFWFVIGVTFLVLILTNLIMNVAAIAICLPVALKIAPYLGVSGEVILFSALVVAGMPFLLLVGAAPNAIAYESKQFSSGEFFKAGVPASLILMVVVAVFIAVIWPMMGMEIYVTPVGK